MNRRIPFGYTVKNGETAVAEHEAEIVKKIFEMYLNGESYLKIANKVNIIGVNYKHGAANWDYNMIRHIINNSEYTGSSSYPAILEDNIFKQASVIRENKYVARIKPSKLDAVKEKVCCAECGANFYRLKDGGRSKPKWLCKQCKTVKFTDNELEKIIVNKINELISNPMRIRQETAVTEQSLEIKRLSNEINRSLDQKESDRVQIKKLLFALADERYKQSDDGESERQTVFLKEFLSEQKPINEFNGELFEKTVRRFHIGNNNIILELVNSQKI